VGSFKIRHGGEAESTYTWVTRLIYNKLGMHPFFIAYLVDIIPKYELARLCSSRRESREPVIYVVIKLNSEESRIIPGFVYKWQKEIKTRKDR